MDLPVPLPHPHLPPPRDTTCSGDDHDGQSCTVGFTTTEPQQRRGGRRHRASVMAKMDKDQVVDIVVPSSTMKHHTSVKMSQFCVEKLAQSRRRLANKLYGREAESDILRRELEMVCEGKAKGRRSMVLISGEKGQGKRALALQLEEEPAVKKSGAFFVEFNLTHVAGEPYAGIKAAMRRLCCQRINSLPIRRSRDGVSGKKSLEELQALIAQKLNWELNLLCQVVPELSILSASLTREMLLKQRESSRNLLRSFGGSVKRSGTNGTNHSDGEASTATTTSPTTTMPKLLAVQESMATTTSTTTNDDVHALKGNVRSAPERLQHALKRLINVLSTFTPLILVCNDAQFADRESLRLLKGWITDTQNQSLMMIWTHQSNLEQGTNHLLSKTIQKIRDVQDDRSIRIREISLESLSQNAVNHMIADLLGVASPQETEELTNIIYHKTFGNMGYVVQYLVSLAEQGHLVFSLSTLQWSWNVEDVRNSLTATDSVVDLMKTKLRESALARQILPLAACLGSTFDIWILQEIAQGIQEHLIKEDSDQEDDAITEIFSNLLDTNKSSNSSIISISNNQLENLENQGLIERAAGVGGGDGDEGTTISYSFIHEGVIEGALSLVGDDDNLDRLKFRMGCILHDRRPEMDEHRADQILFLVVNLLNSRLDDIPKDRIKAVRDINVAAGDEAYLAAAFRPSAMYYGAAVQLLPDQHWEIMYQESLHLLTSAAEAEMCLGNYDQMKVYTDQVLERDDMDILQKMPIYEVNMAALLAQKRVYEAWDESLHVLKQTKSHFPTHKIKVKTAMAIAKLRLHPKHWKPEALDKLPISEDPMDEEITKIHDKQIEMALMVKPNVFPLTIFTAVQHVIDRGLTRCSASVLAWFGVLLCGVLGDFQWGESNLKFVYSLMERFENRLIECRVIVVSTLNVAHWTSPIQQVVGRFITGYTRGMETSDLVTAFWGAYFYHEDAFCSGTNLALLAKDAEVYSKQMADYGMLNHLQNLRSVQELIAKLRGATVETSDSADEGNIPNQKTLQNHLSHSTKDRLRGAAFFGDWELGAELGMKYVELIGKVLLGQYASVVSRFITSLCCFEMAGRHTNKRKKYHRVAMKNFKIIQHWCAKGNPNTQHYLLLLKAEKACCKGKTETALASYKETILLAGRSGFNHDQALACERLASLHSRMGDEISAKYSLEDAVRLYDEWGASKKVELLREQLGKMM